MDNDSLRRGLLALQAGNARDAERLFKTVLREQPRHVAALNLLGITLTQLCKFGDAEAYLRRALREQPKSDATLYNYGIVLKALHRPAEALQRFTEALALNPGAAETWNNRGTVFNDLHRPNEAVRDFEKAIELQPRYAEAFCNKGKTLAMLNRPPDALAAFGRALQLKPDLVEARLGQAGVLTDLHQYDGALADYDDALAIKPSSAEAWLGRGTVFAKLKRYDEALAAYENAQQLNPNIAEIWLGRGNVLTDLARRDEAFAAYDKALILRSNLAEAWLGRGNLFADLNRHDDAFAAYDRALALKPDLAEAWASRGNTMTKLQRYDDAFSAYDHAFRLNPELPYVAGSRLNAKLYMSDWADLESDIATVLSMTRAGKPASVPFPLLAIPSVPSDQLQCAERFVGDQQLHPSIWRGEVYSHDRIRVAYLSNNFHESAMTYLLAGMFERHDRSRFEVSAISFGPQRNSPMRRRLKNAFEHFIDVHCAGDQEIAELLRRNEIDIAVDLMGFTADNRLNVFARRPAPIQVNYMGYPGTMGAPYIDYLVADRTVIPDAARPFYSEKIVWLPNSYFITDSGQPIAASMPTRTQCGLPETGFVFCCFNSNYKILPVVFDIWMRLLTAVDNSVLWLIETSATAVANLRREAEKRGVAPQRLIFAAKMDLPDHLARHRLADLCIDTLPCNAHTTASDSLCAGLPVLSCRGTTLAGRVAASLLEAAGLAELIATSFDDYEAKALKLAHDAASLASIKHRLALNRITCPLFDTARSTRSMEAAYHTMWQMHQSGRPPQSFAVQDGD
ncbi:MAG TPA: tetratricopeptide repeat protein [Xanthobacteraceae bacterium]|jgi:predicted O-linked N-acetylglucosamine transferase (SPINDLY family)